MHLQLVTPDISSNSLGRTYCLWLLVQELGWTADVVATTGDEIWSPLAGTEFARSCRVQQVLDRRSLAGVDLIVSVKPLPASLGVAHRAAVTHAVPLLADVDDPDVEAMTVWRTPVKRVGSLVLTPREQLRLRRLRRLAQSLPTLVSNPVLHEIYGGAVVPHARPVSPEGAAHTSTAPHVAFVGTPRGHKGVDELRAAVGRLASSGFRLTVTSDAPADARTWEHWVGATSLEEGRRLVAEADVVAIPSTGTWARAQLPAKLVDAMMAGRAIAASAVPPVTWALDGAGLTFTPGDVDSVTAALAELRDPARRAELGALARARALSAFSVEALAPVFRDACENAVSRGARPGWSRTPSR